MLSLVEFAKRIEKLTVDNSPALLTGVGVAGTVFTSYLTGKASFKAADFIRNRQAWIDRQEKGYELELKEKFNLTWKLYIPPAIAMTVTVVSIVASNRIGARRAAALATAYAITERAYDEYKDKVKEKFGEKKAQTVQDDVQQDRVNRKPLGRNEVVIIEDGDVFCYDGFSGRYFKSSMEKLKAAQNELNAQVLSWGYASVTDFYNYVGLSATSYSEEVGWTTEKLLQLEFSTALDENGKPVLAFEFGTSPIRNYYKGHI